MKFFFFFIDIHIYFLSFSQVNHDYVWLFGTTNSGNTILSFDDGTRKIEKQDLDTYFYLTNTSMCDTNGNLLFYTNGCFIKDASHSIMENGEELSPGIIYDGNCPNGYSAIRGAIALPMPENDAYYHLFYLGKTIGVQAPFFSYNDRLQYAKIDMTLNNGLGAVIEKNEIIIQDSLYGGAFTAVRHINNQDWWVIIPKAHRNKYFKVLDTANGVGGINEQEIGINPDPWKSGGAEACFSPDGTKYAWYNSTDNVLLFDFDRATGELSNFQQLFADTSDAYYGGLAFSPNSRYLYVTTRNKLWQFDLQASDIQASKQLVGEYDGMHSATFYHMQMGPDCRIYMICTNGVPYLHVIHFPDRPGLECGFEQRSIVLPSTNAISLPNFPHYRLGTPYPVCDSNIVIVSSSLVPPPAEQVVSIFPNPAKGEIKLALAAGLSSNAQWMMFNQLGQPVRQVNLLPGQQETQIKLDVAPGLYFWQVKTEGKLVGSGKLIISK